MEQALLEILAALKTGNQTLDDAWLDKLVRRHNRASHDAARAVAKRRLLPYYLGVKARDPERWRSWEVDERTEQQLLSLLKMKPRRTASGVATITVITKPWPCSSDCLYCPNDVRMPKSYLANEPACQRAERNFFDPYLQVKARLQALIEMGHVTDKVELIVLGGTWSDYPDAYQRWFVRELLRALNDGLSYAGGPERLDEHGAMAVAPGLAEQEELAERGHDPAQLDPARHNVRERTAFYVHCGLSCDAGALAEAAAPVQQRVSSGACSYNQAARALMGTSAWQQASGIQQASWCEVEAQQRINERARHRVVGLVIETRPDLLSVPAARTMRRLGCTKVQMGIQSLDDAVLAANQRLITSAQIARAFAVLRTFGFKIHVHAMVNLLGSTPAADKDDYRTLVEDPRFCPDEIKLYPCALVESAHLTDAYARGAWQPYESDELLDVLVADVLVTPAYVRISRMIRDIASTDILAGNKRTNLRQLVEAQLMDRRASVREIRMREIATEDVERASLQLACVPYETSVARERFLQWVTPEGRIAGFCRLSLPCEPAVQELLAGEEPPTTAGTAMIREVHVYGRVASLGASQQGAAQHVGLGKTLVEEACRLAREAGYERIAVISAMGTRAYYRSLGFADAGLYQLREL